MNFFQELFASKLLPDALQILSVFPTIRTFSLKTTCPDRNVTGTPAHCPTTQPIRLLRLPQGCPLVISSGSDMASSQHTSLASCGLEQLLSFDLLEGYRSVIFQVPLHLGCQVSLSGRETRVQLGFQCVLQEGWRHHVPCWWCVFVTCEATLSPL